MASLLLLVGLVVGASFTGVVVVCSLVMWVREHSCYCSMPCPCKDPSDHKMCGPHKRKWVRLCPYKMFMACHCRWKDECKLSHSEVIFRENRDNVTEKVAMSVFENEDIENNRLNKTADEDFHSFEKDEEIQVTVLDTKEYERRRQNRNIEVKEVF